MARGALSANIGSVLVDPALCSCSRSVGQNRHDPTTGIPLVRVDDFPAKWFEASDIRTRPQSRDGTPLLLLSFINEPGFLPGSPSYVSPLWRFPSGSPISVGGMATVRSCGFRGRRVTGVIPPGSGLPGVGGVTFREAGFTARSCKRTPPASTKLLRCGEGERYGCHRRARRCKHAPSRCPVRYGAGHVENGGAGFRSGERRVGKESSAPAKSRLKWSICAV